MVLTPDGIQQCKGTKKKNQAVKILNQTQKYFYPYKYRVAEPHNIVHTLE